MTKIAAVLFATSVLAFGQAPSTPAKSFGVLFDDVNRRLLAMAQDFPEDKYSYRATKDVRSFREIVVHVGKNQKRQANLFDPDGTRIELMEPDTITGKPTPPSTAPPPQTSTAPPQ